MTATTPTYIYLAFPLSTICNVLTRSKRSCCKKYFSSTLENCFVLLLQRQNAHEDCQHKYAFVFEVSLFLTRIPIWSVFVRNYTWWACEFSNFVWGYTKLCSIIPPWLEFQSWCNVCVKIYTHSVAQQWFCDILQVGYQQKLVSNSTVAHLKIESDVDLT